MTVVLQNQGDFILPPHSEDLRQDLEAFHPTCLSANTTMEDVCVDFTQAALAGTSGTQIIESAFAHKN